MPYTVQHKKATRERIVECARRLFNRKGFGEVSIDEVMGEAGLTRGGFYNHFASKDELFVAVVDSSRNCNPAERWDGVELDFSARGEVLSRQMINAYLSHQHLEDIEGQCPLITLPSDISRAGPEVRVAYEATLERMASMFAWSGSAEADRRARALALVALCVGGMVLARTVNDAGLADEVREAARKLALEVAER